MDDYPRKFPAATLAVAIAIAAASGDRDKFKVFNDLGGGAAQVVFSTFVSASPVMSTIAIDNGLAKIEVHATEFLDYARQYPHAPWSWLTGAE